MATNKDAPRQLLVASTGEPMQPVRLYYVFPRGGRERVVRKLDAIRCVHSGREGGTWQWLQMEEALKVDFSQWASTARPVPPPVLLGMFAFPKSGGLTLTVRSHHRAVAAARFFSSRLGRDVVLSRARVVNRWFSGPEAAGGLEAIDEHLDRDVVVIDPRAAEVAFEECFGQGKKRTIEELERLSAEYLELRRKDDIPAVEDFPLHPEEETPDFKSLATTLLLRFARASEHWQGKTNVTLTDIIMRLTQAMTAAQAGGPRP